MRQPTGRPDSPRGSFAARFGKVILQDGIAAIPSALYHFQGRLGLTAQQVWFVSYILAHKWAGTLPHPSLNKMAECTGVDRRVLQYRCAELSNLGLLQIQSRYGERGDQSTNYFDFAGLFEQLEAILLDEPAIPNPIRDAEGREPIAGAGAIAGGDPFGPESNGTAVVASALEALGSDAPTDYSFLARYGRVLLRYGIATVPKAIFTHQAGLGLTPQQVWFVCYILSFQWDASLPYPSINKMAERTGYSKRQLLRIKDDLVEAGYLEVVRRTSSDRGNDTNAYDFSLLFEAIRKQLQPSEAADPSLAGHEDEPASSDAAEGTNVVGGQDGRTAEETSTEPERRHRSRAAQPRARGSALGPQHVAPMQAQNGPAPVEHHVTRGIAHYVTRGVAQGDTRGVEQGVTYPVEQEVTGALEQHVTGAVTQISRTPWHGRSPGGQKGESPEVEALKIEPRHKDDSNRLTPNNRLDIGRSDRVAYATSTYIAAVASDLSRELGDTAHEASNIKQAVALWTGCGLTEQQFVELMQQARKLTRRYQSRPTWDAMNNRMAYYFTTLRDLLSRVGED